MSLRETEHQILRSMSARHRQVASHCDVVSEGGCPSEVSLISSGFACRYKQLQSGLRQITGFLIPGDICDLRAALVGRMDHSVGALRGCEIAVIPHRLLRGEIEKQPRLMYGLWKETILEASICREWVMNVGRRNAYGRLAHLFCEVWCRLRVQGLASDHSFEFPVSQSELADAVGLSVVHVNRTIQQMRAEGLISFRSHSVTLLDQDGLQEVAEFNSDYLQVSSPACRTAAD